MKKASFFTVPSVLLEYFLLERLSSILNRDIMEIMTKELLPADKERVKQMNPVVLAFVGDAAYTLLVRRNLALESNCKTGELNRRAS